MNLFTYYLKIGEKNKSKQNYEIIQNEDNDVSQERNIVMSTNIDVN